MQHNQPKILLINPVTEDHTRVLRVERCQQKLLRQIGIWPPITLLEIAIYLKHKDFRNIEIIDGEVENLSFNALISEVIKRIPDLVLIQATTPTIDDDILFSSLIKQKLNNTAIVFTGLHATVFPQQLLMKSSIDYVILGEPEEIVPELVNSRFNGSPGIKNLKGVGYKEKGNVFINERRPPRDNYDYPVIPDRGLLKNDRYIMPLTGKPFTVIKVSRGCNYQCSFCTSEAYYSKGWRSRSPQNIIEEIKDVKNNYGINTFLFLADTFNADNEFVTNLSSMIIDEKLGINWVSNSRVDLVDNDSVRLMKKAGCMLVSLGIESYDQGVLKLNNKNLAPETIERNTEIFSKNGIMTYGYFVFGLKGETKKSVLKTIFLASKSDLDFAIFYSLTPYPGTEYFTRHNNYNWREYFHGISNIIEYDHLNRRVIKLAIFMAYILFYMKPKRLFSLLRFLIKGKAC